MEGQRERERVKDAGEKQIAEREHKEEGNEPFFFFAFPSRIFAGNKAVCVA